MTVSSSGSSSSSGVVHCTDSLSRWLRLDFFSFFSSEVSWSRLVQFRRVSSRFAVSYRPFPSRSGLVSSSLAVSSRPVSPRPVSSRIVSPRLAVSSRPVSSRPASSRLCLVLSRPVSSRLVFVSDPVYLVLFHFLHDVLS